MLKIASLFSTIFVSFRLQVFLNQIFDCIFALPTPNNRMLPKCKTKESRRAAFDVLVELVKGSVENYSLLHSKILRQHQKGYC